MGVELRELCLEDESAFRAAVAEFEACEGTNPEVPFAFVTGKSRDFPAYVEMLRAWQEGRQLPENHVPGSFLLGFEGDRIVGRVSIRHTLGNDFLKRIGGNIGYAVIPSCRGKGVATELLRQALVYCSGLGLERVLVTCDIDNPASQRVIEKNGGVFECLYEEPGLRVPKRRYWIETVGAIR